MQKNTRARVLPLLDNIRIASPCSEAWDGMVGDDRVRFCGGCEKNVYNLSAMTTVEAQELIAAQEGEVCVRLYQRKDGTVITADCPVGVRRKQVTKVAAAALALGASGLALAAAEAASPQVFDADSHDVRYRRHHTTSTETPESPKAPGWFERLIHGEEEEPEVRMGDISPVPPPTAPTHRVLMGAVAPPKKGNDQVPTL